MCQGNGWARQCCHVASVGQVLIDVKAQEWVLGSAAWTSLQDHKAHSPGCQEIQLLITHI